jgi:hypothetical protein
MGDSPVFAEMSIYRPLRSDGVEIRLLEIVPDDEKTKLSFRLHYVSLNKTPKFWALSYTWGKPGDLRPIFINGYRI